ncbi:hypothetical protein PTSG_02157 [Salpingoeca rosetta]|uniref:Regulator of microtubule dynamics protein 1 n=1 Tax=Salpingoeca rosetta (strain ATCC 50818 / BSB-021) TaxID=946362 RepID=F2U1D4_SALR5|nr:uncharacterized protein PTSG_02157 [Salpingoeca rosetta]EGD81436.1 hypothetical protein PTSG_02157 [Salpingoeca rosetta]|eukprot:XP_004996640.1 hypothetical protein PTSG_02157 [Salpingoeca rosetta]
MAIMGRASAWVTGLKDSLLADDWRVFAAGMLAGASITGVGVWLWSRRSESSGTLAALRDISATLKSIDANIAKQQGQQREMATQRARSMTPFGLSEGEEEEEEEDFYDEDEEFQEATDTLMVGEAETARSQKPSQRQQQRTRAAAAKPSLFEQIDAEYEASNQKKALDLVLQHQDELEQTVDGLWRIARSMYDKSTFSKGSELTVLQEAQPIARRAIDQDPTCSEAHKWYAVITGAMAEHVSLNEKLQCGHVFKQHVEEAIRLNTNDGLAYHLLGRWCLEVAGLSWWEKKACAALIGAPPEATYDDALSNLLKAHNLKPTWPLNILFIGKCYLKLGNKSRAAEWFERCTQCEPKTDEDRELIQEARSLM